MDGEKWGFGLYNCCKTIRFTLENCTFGLCNLRSKHGVILESWISGFELVHRLKLCVFHNKTKVFLLKQFMDSWSKECEV